MTEFENELSVIDVALEAIHQEMERLRQQEKPLMDRRAAIISTRRLAEYSLSVGDKLAITPAFKAHIRLRFSVRTYDDVLNADYLIVLTTDGPDSAVIVTNGNRQITTRVPLVLVAKMKRRYQADQKRGLADENID